MELARPLPRASLTAVDPAGLPNRRAFLAALQGSGRSAVVFVDLDRFKAVNDSLGHATGDTLLRATGVALRAAAAPDDVVARLAGDEFTVLLRGDRTEAELDAAVERLRVAAAGAARAVAPGTGVSASVGAAWHEGSAEDTLARADLAVYTAKHAAAA